MNALVRWSPALVIALGALVTLGVDGQRRMPLSAPLASAIPLTLAGLSGQEVPVSDAAVQAARSTDFVMRAYGSAGTADGFSLYVAYYDRQSRGSTIHSPKNCLPGAGWGPIEARNATIGTGKQRIQVKRYLLQKGNQQVLVLYWYQGRGRVAANEYLVKWHLLRDAFLKRRTDEALVRIVVPVTPGQSGAFALAAHVAEQVTHRLELVLPT